MPRMPVKTVSAICEKSISVSSLCRQHDKFRSRPNGLTSHGITLTSHDDLAAASAKCAKRHTTPQIATPYTGSRETRLNFTRYAAYVRETGFLDLKKSLYYSILERLCGEFGNRPNRLTSHGNLAAGRHQRTALGRCLNAALDTARRGATMRKSRSRKRKPTRRR